jgi:uncharacterized low-complexity protein
MNKKMKLAGLILGAALTTSVAFAANGSCGAGKCGGEAKKEMTEKAAGSCGSGKCGGDMKKEAKSDMKDTKSEMKEKATGSCGTGKCGSK